jgi:protease-4
MEPLFGAMVVWAGLLALPPANLTTLPGDVSGYVRGAAAVGVDPAAAGRLDGFELQLRQRSLAGGDVDPEAAGPQPTGIGSWALYGDVPVRLLPISLFGGYEWGQLPQARGGRSTLGASIRLIDGVYAGLSVHGLMPRTRVPSTRIWDIGLLWEPTAAISLSAGFDSLNAASGVGVRLPRAGRLGLALRPWHGQPWLTLAADGRLTGGYRASWTFLETRAALDVAPIEGLHLTAGYANRNSRNLLWLGLGVDVLGLGLWGGMQPTAQAHLQGSGSLTYKQQPTESLVRPQQRVELALGGTLRPAPGTLLRGPPAISTAAYDLDSLADEPTVDEVVLPLRGLQVGLGTTDELRAALLRLRSRGKRVRVDLESADDKTYMVAAAADALRFDPVGRLTLDGFASTQHFFYRALSRLRLRFDAVALGAYKSAPDALLRSSPQPPDVEQRTALLAQAQASLRQVLQADRHLSPPQVEAVLTQALFDATGAAQAGLIDRIDPPLQPGPQALLSRQVQGIAPSAVRRPTGRWGPQPIVQVVPIVGTLVQSAGAGAGAGAWTGPLSGGSVDVDPIIAQLEAARRSSQVIGVVLRIDSPGGDVEAAERLWRAVHDLSLRKPVVASMGEVAASGGYYVATAAPTILAQPNTVTGSIGIFILRPDLSGLLDAVGIDTHVYASTPQADWESVEHGLAPADRLRLQASLQSYYTTFVERVAVGRGLLPAQVRQLGDGRIYSGEHARRVGLVDEMGGLADAVRLVKKRARVDPWEAVRVDIPEQAWSLWNLFGGRPPLLEAAAQAADRLTPLLQDKPLALYLGD